MLYHNCLINSWFNQIVVIRPKLTIFYTSKSNAIFLKIQI